MKRFVTALALAVGAFLFPTACKGQQVFSTPRGDTVRVYAHVDSVRIKVKPDTILRVRVDTVTITETDTVTVAGDVVPAVALGIPFGEYECDASSLAPFGMCVRAAGTYSSATLAAFRAKGAKLILNQGGYGKFKDAQGRFDPAKYTIWLNSIASAVQTWGSYVSDSTLFAVQVIDDRGASNWGGVAITNAQIDEMARQWKVLLPGVLTVVREKATGLTGYTYVYLDASISQYNADHSGTISSFVSQNVAAAASARLGLIFSLNVLNGGSCKPEFCVPGTSSGLYNMGPNELRTYANAMLGATGVCAFTAWRLDATYLARPGVVGAFTYIAGQTATKPTASCRVR